MTVGIPSAMQQGSVPLFLRSSTVTVGNTQIQNIGLQQGLDVEFKVVRSLKPTDPNTCDLKIYGLSDDTQQQLANASQAYKPAGGPTTKVIPVRIDAGFVNNTSTIFLGEMRAAETTKDGQETETELSTGDGDDALVIQRISQSFAPGATPVQVVQALLSQMGVGQGNLGAVKPILAGSSMFTLGVNLKGNAAETLTKICASAGLEFSLQNGQAQFLPRGQPLAGEAYLLGPNTGLWGSPTVDTKGVMQCQCALLPGLAPGVPVQIQSAYVQGLFRITTITTTGSTAGGDWSHQIEAKRFGAAA
jgi:hypothetical protein